MGYQESFIYVKDDKNFDRLVELVRKQAATWENWRDIEAVEILELNKNITISLEEMCMPDRRKMFKKGKKFILVVGERSGQRSIYRMFGNAFVRGSKDFIPDVDIIFAECFADTGIFEKRQDIATITPFDFKMDTEYHVL